MASDLHDLTKKMAKPLIKAALTDYQCSQERHELCGTLMMGAARIKPAGCACDCHKEKADGR